MILRARGVKPTPSKHLSSSLPETTLHNKPRRHDRKYFHPSNVQNIILSLVLFLCILLYFTFFRMLRWDVDVRNEHQSHSPNSLVVLDLSKVKSVMKSIRDEFVERYGGEEMATNLLSRGIIPLKDDGEDHELSVKSLSDMLFSTLHSSKKTSLLFSFGGYSVTVGRGNYFHQSFPFIFQKTLQPLFQSLNVQLQVHNGAIGGIPSFPYGWCLPQNLGKNASLIGWDYGMNEKKSITGLESYIRHAVSVFDEPPILVVLDGNKAVKKNLLKHYVSNGILPHAILLNNEDYVPKDYFQKQNVPSGLQDWEKWGAPKGAPGQSPWHPKYKRHELMGWVLAMHFLEGMEQTINKMESSSSTYHETKKKKHVTVLPPPISQLKDEFATSLFHGVPITNGSWKMNHISCRTTFQPVLSGHLSDIVTSGMINPSMDILQERPDELYKQGWVVDLGEVERQTKQKNMKYGGLGYIDRKEALYGIPESGVLEMFIPYEIPIRRNEEMMNRKAMHWFQSLVICEVNEKRTKEECDMEKDLRIVVGGREVKERKKIRETGAEYLGKQICIYAKIPDEAVVEIGTNNVDVGLRVKVEVSGESVTREKGACTISHVVWEHVSQNEGNSSISR